MKTFNLAKIAASSLVMGAALAGYGPAGETLNSVTTASAEQQEAGQADAYAKRAQKALGKGDAAKAVRNAEAAVGLRMHSADLRMLLGEAYLAAGRLSSAEASFADALELSPGNARAALKLSLVKIALGKVDAGRSILDEHKPALSAADYGLAVALGGDLDAATTVLEAAIREDGGDARTRQNLALSYALAGKWVQARVLASQDLSPDLVDGRMTQWAALARPRASWDQVAGVLGIKPVEDSGRPVALALNRASNVEQAAAEPAPIAATQAVDVAAAAPEAPAYDMAASAPAPDVAVEAAPAPVVVAEAAPAPAKPSFEMGPRQEIVQRIPEAPMVKAASTPMKRELARAASGKSQRKAFIAEDANAPRQAVVAAKSGKVIESGDFVVQLGAFSSKAAAEKAWKRATGKVDDLSGHEAVTAKTKAKGKELHRLAASGFTNLASAQQVCKQVKAAGGDCFVRGNAKDNGIRWAFLGDRTPTRLASR